MPKTWDYLKEWCDELLIQLRDEDYLEWGDAWLKAPYDGIPKQCMEQIELYFLKQKAGGEAIPWKKVAGFALIAWIHGKHPELWSK